MTYRPALFIFSCAVTIATSLQAAETASARPADDVAREIAALIHQLGDDDFRLRDAAARRLTEIGQPALPALARSRRSTDPEVSLRSISLIRQIQHRPSLFDDVATGGKDKGERQVMELRMLQDGVHTYFADGSRRIEIVTTPEEIRVVATGMRGGQFVTEEVCARSLEELRQKNPDAYRVYARTLRFDGITVRWIRQW